MFVSSDDSAGIALQKTTPAAAWSSLLSASLVTLRKLAGTTEKEFLQIGSKMQAVHQKSHELSTTSHRLVEVASGERLQGLIDRLRQILTEMEHYLGQAQEQNSTSCNALNGVENLLRKVAPPLEGVKKMCKHLYVFEVSIKIESAYLGDMGSEFINLAQDIKKLSRLTRDKVDAIKDNCQLLSAEITRNNVDIQGVRTMQDAKAAATLGNSEASLSGLAEINERFSALGAIISSISDENSQHISGIVQSMQFHDIYRQQVEHVIEALSGLLPSLEAQPDGREQAGEEATLAGKTGDICELQEAQLQFASAELYSAITTIIDNLKDIGLKQRDMAQQIYAQTGTMDSSGSSFIDKVSSEMGSLVGLIKVCSESNRKLVQIMKKVTGTIREITGFVSDIEEIGQEIIQIALNARIKAASAGTQGASMGVLADAIGQLSNSAVQRTELITSTLTEIDATTAVLTGQVSVSGDVFGEKLTAMNAELGGILRDLENISSDLMSLVARIQRQVNVLTRDIDNLTGGIDVHRQTKSLAEEVLRNMKQVFGEARAMHPASEAFKEDLRLMAQRYTMESERRIHESIALRHGVHPVETAGDEPAGNAGDESEFGDNVDLF